MKVQVLRLPAGSGKTALAIAALKKGIFTEIYVPDHKLGAEIEKRIRATHPQLSVSRILGRSQPGPSGAPMCQRHQEAAALSSAGLSVYPNLCRSFGAQAQQCMHFNTCVYQKQFTKCDVRILTHASLPKARGVLDAEVPKLAIIDEAFYSKMLSHEVTPISELVGTNAHYILKRVGADLVSALASTRPLNGLRKLVNTRYFTTALALLAQPLQGIDPTLDARQQLSAQPLIAQHPRLARLMARVSDIVTGRAQVHSLEWDASNGTITVHSRGELSRLSGVKHALLLDASADEEIVRTMLPDAQFTGYDAVRKARVVQVRSTRCSKYSLTSAPDSAKRRAELEAIVARVAQRHQKVLLVGPLSIVGDLSTARTGQISVPINVDVAHFHALRGVDAYKNHDAVIVAGRSQPSLQGLEKEAKALFFDQPLKLASDWSTEFRGYNMRSGTMGVEAQVHPDPRIQAICEQIREQESIQAIDRIRLVHALNGKAVYILSNLPLPIVVDATYTWDEMVAGTRIEQAWYQSGGTLSMNPQWLANSFPQHWKTPAAAKQDVEAHEKAYGLTNMISIGNPMPFPVHYRPAGARGSMSKALVSTQDPKQAKLALEAAIGRRLTDVRFV